ncbi:hypothetical protein GSI_01643 [Ganoderma sinense ZZ0214-1]|uniref:Protein kinase domain-containing protein n=1 Tax=Ganoderma sinense ZZ0214-1 TaxID=1077348 RepID=A0A2G8SQI8_9APHY|nr:hypothetical protein GSI_01643 [Ganoderma sinense ZZ0214-1]
MASEIEKETNPYADDRLFYRNLPGGYLTREFFWRDHQPWLQEQGYMLRPRYHPDWKPTWAGTKKDSDDCEDGHISNRLGVMDARRISDDHVVVLKKVKKYNHPYEAEIGRLTARIRPQQSLRTRGLEFMHAHHVAHRDIMDFNVMLDPAPLHSEIPHLVDKRKSYDFKRRVRRFSRTERPIKYYYIDFGISRKYAPDEDSPLEDIIVGGDKSVPEFEGTDEPQNPFWTDIYYLGNLIRIGFLERTHGFEFMQSFVEDMVQKDPEKRPIISQARSRFEGLRGSLSERKLRSRVMIYRDEFAVFSFFRDTEALMQAAWGRGITSTTVSHEKLIALNGASAGFSINAALSESEQGRRRDSSLRSEAAGCLYPATAMEEDVHGEESTSPYSAPSISADLSQLSEPEAWWRDHQQWLEERGYMLRPRYRPGWQPSWIVDPRKPRYDCEDMDPPISSYILDAVRISDSESVVVLKKVISWRNPHEVEISQYLSSDALRSNPRNHSVHI